MTILIILFVIIGLSALILLHEAGHFFCSKIFGLKVEEFGIGFPPRIFAWRSIKNKGTPHETRGETEYSVNWLPFGGFVKIAGENGEFSLEEELANNASEKSEGTGTAQVDEKRLFYHQPAWKKSIILLAGVFMNFIIGWLLISFALTVSAPKALIISDIEPSSPAAAAGFAQGDVIKNFSNSDDFIAFVNAHRGQTITVDILRESKELNINVVPRVITGTNEGAIGVYLEDAGHAGENVFAALWDGLKSAGTIAWLTIVAFGRLVQQLFLHGSLLTGVVGPVGIFGVAEETGKIGATYFIQFLGIISVNLAVVNLIPFPAVDGGRFLMTVIEKIKGSPVPEKVEGWVNGLGFAFLLILMVLLTIRDVVHLF
jgi:regulator of sigma E protease